MSYNDLLCVTTTVFSPTNTEFGAGIDEFMWQKIKECAITYHQVSNIRRTLQGNRIVDHSDVVGASPVSATPTTSSFST